MTILVFKTNVRTKTMIRRLAPEMEQLGGLVRWNVDLQDIDKVLRVEGTGITVGIVVDRLRKVGYDCEELPD